MAERIFCRRRFSGVPAGVYRGFFSLLPPLLLLDPVPVRHPGPIPSNISALAGGVLFGTWVSFLLTFSAVLAGSLLVFSWPAAWAETQSPAWWAERSLKNIWM
ncbi:MAG: hypothetical protein ACLUJG_07215 [Lawsonibacter sp.]